MSTRNLCRDDAAVPTRLVDVSAPGNRSSVWSSSGSQLSLKTLLTDLTNVQHGQHDGRDVGEFTCQTQRQHLTNAASPELHTHDTCAGNTDPLNLPQHSAANTASVWFNSLSFIPSSLLVSRCSWGTKMWLLRRWVCSSTTDEVQLWSTCTLLSLLLFIYFLQQWWKKHPGPLL